jgi:hypothetical protein
MPFGAGDVLSLTGFAATFGRAYDDSMAQELVCPGCRQARCTRVLRAALGVLLLLAVLVGLAMLVGLFLLLMSPFTGGAAEYGPTPWLPIFAVALLPWPVACSLVLARGWLRRRVLRPVPAPTRLERGYLDAPMDLRCPQHRGE